MKQTRQNRILKLQNEKLKNQVQSLQNSRDSNSIEIKNSLSQLVTSVGNNMSNLASLNPILQNNLYTPVTINWILLTYMYKTHGVIQTAIDVPVLDALRGGVEIQSGELEVEEINDLEEDAEDSEALNAICNAEKWARLYGGGAVIINTEQDPEEPFDITKLRPDSKLEFYSANRWELTTSHGWNPQANIMNGVLPWANSSHISDEWFYFYNQKIHRSRIIILTGKEAPYIIKWQLAGWGMSEIERMVEDFNKILRANEVVYELLEEAKIDVYQFENFAQMASSGTALNDGVSRIQNMNRLKNFNHAIVLDGKDKYEQKQLTFTGLAEMKKELRIDLASALRIPMTKLYGLSASGFNSGEDDIENYNAMVESEVRHKLKKPIKRLYDILAYRRFGFEPHLDIKYKPLRVLGAVEEEQIKHSKHERYIQLYDRSLLSSKEHADINMKENLIPIETEAQKGLLEDHPTSTNQFGMQQEGNDGQDGQGKNPKGE